MIKGIVFDKDGTLLEFVPFWVAVAEHTVRLLLQDKATEEKVQKVMQAIGAYEGISGLLCRGTYASITDKINEASGEQFTMEQAYAAFYQSVNYGKVVPTCENLQGVLRQFKDMGIKIGVVTTDEKEITDNCLSQLGVLGMMDVVFTDDGVHPTKPNPYYMQQFLQGFGLNPNEVLMVGDTLTDMNFAKNSGVKGVAVAKNERDAAYLQNSAYVVLHDVSQVIEVVNKINGTETI